MSSTDPIAEEECARLRQALMRAVHHVCPHWLADRADDLGQVAMMRLMDTLRRREEGEAIPSSYLRKAAYSAVVDEIRRLRRRQETALDESGEETEWAAAAPDPEQRARGRETGRAIRDCLATLIRPRRSAVVLHLQGHKGAEVAGLLGWSAKRVENLTYRGIADLQRCLEEKGMRR